MKVLILTILCVCTLGLVVGQQTQAHTTLLSNKHLSSPSFTENKGQVVDQNLHPQTNVLFYGITESLVYHLKKDGISYQQNRVDSWMLRDEKPGPQQASSDSVAGQTTVYRTDIKWLGTNEEFDIEIGKEHQGVQHFYLAQCPNGITDVKSFQSVTYKHIYDGIDLRWYNHNGYLEYDFILEPLSNPRQIAWTVSGTDTLFVNEKGELVMQTPLGLIVEKAPQAFQEGHEVGVNWKIEGNKISFQLEQYQVDKTLRIDPIIRPYASYFGGTEDDFFNDIAYDDSSDCVIVGRTESTLSTLATIGAHQSSHARYQDGLIAKFDEHNQRLWSTFYGGQQRDELRACSVDDSMNIYSVGTTSSKSAIATARQSQGYTRRTWRRFHRKAQRQRQKNMEHLLCNQYCGLHARQNW